MEEEKLLSLTEELPKEMERCRNLLEQYRAEGNNPHSFWIIDETLKEAVEATNLEDVLGMAIAYMKLKDFK